MADTKVSELPAATSVAVSDVLVINQNGVTKKLPVSVLTGTLPVTQIPTVTEPMWLALQPEQLMAGPKVLTLFRCFIM